MEFIIIFAYIFFAIIHKIYWTLTKINQRITINKEWICTRLPWSSYTFWLCLAWGWWRNLNLPRVHLHSVNNCSKKIISVRFIVFRAFRSWNLSEPCLQSRPWFIFLESLYIFIMFFVYNFLSCIGLFLFFS